MKKIIFFFILFFNCVVYLNAQYTDEFAKYWFYRWRFKDFVKVGAEQGESIPIGERNIYADGHHYVKWGDGTQKLGMYMCLLATEYKLLKNNNRLVDLENTKTELYYAIEAIKRLDCKAETYLPYDFTELCNGFFLRDDIPSDFLNRPAEPWNSQSTLTNKDVLNNPETQFCYTYPNQNTIEEIADFQSGAPEAYLNGSDFIVMQNDPFGQNSGGNLANEESHDQAICLFQGLGLIIKMVDQGNQNITLNDGSVIQYDIHAEASNMYKKILEYIKYETEYFGLPTGQVDWLITNFFDNMVTAPQGGQSGNSIPFSFPMAQAGNMVLGPNSAIALNSAYLGLPTGFHDYISIASRFIWNQLIQTDYSNDPNQHTVNQSMYVQLAAMSDSWRLFVPGSTNYLLNVGMNFINTTPASIYGHAVDYDWEAFYVPLWAVWNNKSIPNIANLRNKVLTAINDDLSSAPCEGPYRFNIFNFTPQWGGNFKYFRGYDETHYGDGNAVSGYFNGMDYMILYNLFALSYNQPLPYFHNIIDRQIDYPVPGFPSNIPFPQPVVVNAFHSITASSTVQTNNTVDYRAGYEMTWKPGFHVEAGANFHAFIEPFTCVNGEYRNAESDSTLATAYGFNEKFLFKNHGIIDYNNDESEEMMNEELETEIDPSHVILVYPNPSDGKFSYLIPEKTDDNIIQTVEVYNTIGDVVFSQQVNYSGQNVLDLGEVTRGIYIIKVISGEIVYSAKLMVE